ncbi:hypothetical protein TrVE_jg7400 [Triparma verrucosa]|uniref:LAGLIDADG homing endonuclease n=1 Tax=Triparma verrucosa TaxID=1606542 RepID=A0A9W7FCV8_9STRA|nr:hypothetical protein TrVE_jg7400 [Triparma verrucosa]
MLSFILQLSLLLLLLQTLLLPTSSKPLKPGYGVVKFSTPLKSLSFPSSSSSSSSPYQFCGLLNEKTGSVKWYARKSPAKKTFKLRLISVDKRALLRDMLLQKKLDVDVQYKNTGRVDGETGKFLVEPIYEPRGRNLWTVIKGCSDLGRVLRRPPASNRERRLRDGLYTDGSRVYSAGYDYSSGKNFMRNRGSLLEWCRTGKINSKEKNRLIEKVKTGTPDVVREPTNGQ